MPAKISLTLWGHGFTPISTAKKAITPMPLIGIIEHGNQCHREP